MVKKQNFVKWVQSASLFMQKQKIVIEILQKMLKQDLTLQIFNQPDHCLQGKKIIGLMKDELGGQIKKEFGGLRARLYSYLKYNNDENKKNKKHKKVSHKKNLNLKMITTVQKQLKLKRN